MANEATVDQQQLQSTINELYARLSELFPAQRDALRNALNTIQVGEDQRLGMLAAADDLATAPIGDPAVLRDRLNLESVLGALASLDTLSEADVGNAELLRQKLGIGEVLETLGKLASLDTLSDAEVGDAEALRMKLHLSNILGGLAGLNKLSEAEVGDAEIIRNSLGLVLGGTNGNVLTVGQFGIREPIDWVYPTLLNGWENYGGSYKLVSYCKDALGRVYIRGLVRRGNPGTAIFRLPVGFRPGGISFGNVSSSNGGMEQVTIFEDGLVSQNTANSVSFLQLSDISSFFPEA